MKNNNSLLITILTGAVFCFVFLGITLIFPSKSNNLRGINAELNNQINLGDENDYCNYTTQYYVDDVAGATYSGGNCTSTCVSNTCPSASENFVSCDYCTVTSGGPSGNNGVIHTCTKRSRQVCSSCSRNGYTVVNGHCVLSCGVGQGEDPSATTGCSNCAPGRYSADGDNVCHECQVGTFSAAGAESCTACPTGYTTSGTGKSSCDACTTGYIMNNDTNQCIPDSGCSDNQYKNSSNTCSTCEAGYYCNGTSRTKCEGNTYSNNGATSCESCPAHSVANSDNTACVCDSANGYIQDSAGNCVQATQACYCRLTGGTCTWGVAASGYELQTNIPNTAACTAYSNGAMNACFKDSSGEYVWGMYGATSGYTYEVTSNKTTCEEKNGGTSNPTYILRCPTTSLTVGEDMNCTFEASNGATLADGSSNDSTVAKAEKNGSYVKVTALKVGSVTIKGVSSDGNDTNGVVVTVMESGNTGENCEITEVKVDQTITSLDEDEYSSNSYYIVHVSVAGLGCNKNILSLSATYSNRVSPNEVNITTSGRTAQYSFHVYPQSCKESTPTAKLHPTDGTGSDKTKQGSSVTILGDWQKQPTTGCFKPNGNHMCTGNECYDSFLEADLAKANEYYGAWDSTNMCYTRRWTRGGCGGSSTPTPVEEYACYADNADLSKATKAEWQTGPTTQLPHKINGINRPDDCRTVTVVNPTYACYADNADLTKATKAEWQTGPTTQLPYKINGISNSNDCRITPIIPHCYIDDSGIYQWTANPRPSWKLVSGVTKESDCKENEEPACYLTPSGDYDWGLHAKDSGYTLITSITNQSSCVKPTVDYACYKDANNNYVWSTAAPSGYTKVDTITNPKDCAPDEEPACYVHDDDFIWGKYEKVTGYIKIENITDEANCELPEDDACYVDKNGKYVWGQYKDDKDYKLVSSITEMSKCTNNVVVPSTGISASRLIYIAVAILMACGIGFIYYSTAVKKNN